MFQVNLLPGAISEILASAATTGVLTLSERYGLMAAALDESLDEEEARAINRLWRFVVKGRVKVVDLHFCSCIVIIKICLAAFRTIGVELSSRNE